MKKNNKNMKMDADMKANKKNKKKVCVSDMDQPILTSPMIDKISVVIDMPDQKLHGQMIHEILSCVEEHEPGFVQVKGFGHFTVAVNIQCPDDNGAFHKGNPSVLLQATKKEYTKPQVRLEFNPSKLFAPMNALHPSKGDPAKDYLDFVFQCLWGDGFFEFLYHARVTRADICMGIMNRSPDDYLFRVKHAQTSQCMFGSSGTLETLYFGKGSGNQVAIYNKGKHLKADHDSIRIEPRLKFKNMKIAELWGLKNPFKRVIIYSLKNDNPPYGIGHWTAFQDACRLRGISKAIKCQPKSYHYKLNKALSEQSVTWWGMDDDTWTWLWHEALEGSWLNHIPNASPKLNLHEITGG